MQASRKQLSPTGLWSLIHSSFAKKFPNNPLKETPGILDSIMSCCAVFNLKFPSLLQYDNKKAEEKIRHNLNRLC